jgi:hypothetical protein
MLDDRDAIEAETEGDDAYRAVVEGLHHGVLILRGASVVFANRAIFYSMGYARAELNAVSGSEICSPIDPDAR